MPSDKEEKIPLSIVKKFPYKTLNRMIKKMRDYLKRDKIVLDMFKEYGVDIAEIDYVPMMFGDLDVSAKTNKGVITFNYALLCDGNWTRDYSYGVHELQHFLQRSCGDKATKSSDDGNYLENPYERRAFSKQVEYIDETQGPEEAEQYVEDLLDHHEIDSEKKRDELEAVLLKDVE